MVIPESEELGPASLLELTAVQIGLDGWILGTFKVCALCMVVPEVPLNDQRPLREYTVGVINTVTMGKLSATRGVL